MITNSIFKKINHFLLIIIVMIVSFISLCILFLNLNKGFNLSDESYYILSFTQPQRRLFELSHFSYELGSLYSLTNKNLIMLRGGSVVILLVLSFIFSLTLNNYIQKQKKPYSYLIISSITLSSLYYYNPLLFTPSYNWLNLIAILITNIGLLSYFKRDSYSTNSKILATAYAILVGIGVGLTFIDKPPSAILLSFCIILWTIYHHYKYTNIFETNRFILVSFITTVIYILAHAFIYFHGLENYINDLIRALNAAKILGINHNLSMVFSKSILDLFKFLFHPHLIKLFLVLSFFWTLNILSRKIFSPIKYDRLYNYFIHSMLLLPTTVFLSEIFLMFINDIFPSFKPLPHLRETLNSIGPGPVLSGYLFMLLFSCINIQIYSTNNCNIKNLKENNTPIAIFMLGMSFCYAFGTNNNFVYQLCGAGIFIISSIFILLTIIQKNKIKYFYQSIFIAINAIFILLSCYHGYLHPYESTTSIQEQKEAIRFFNSNYDLYVDKKTSQYINKLKSTALKFNWNPNTLLINLTPDSNGSLVIIDAVIPGAAWLTGGTHQAIDGNAYVKHILNQIPHKLLKNAWILTKNGDTKIDNYNILKEYNFPKNYIPIATLKHPQRHEYQTLWKPCQP